MRSGTLPEAIRAAAMAWPDKTWLDFSGERYTFKEADEKSWQLARGLVNLSVGRGDRVCFLFDNHAELVFLMLALGKLGAVSVPINTAYKGEFLRHQIADSGARVIIADAAYAASVCAVLPDVPVVRALIVRGDHQITSNDVDLYDYASVAIEDQSPLQNSILPSDLAALLYTSGTTGPAKGCMISHSYVCNAGWQATTRTLVGLNDVYWTPCPLFHMGGIGLMTGTLQIGATASVYPRFSLSNFWPEIERSGATVVLILSSMIQLVADLPESDVSRRCHGQLRVVMGVPFNAELQQKWKDRHGARFAGPVGYGMTEANPIVARWLNQPCPPGSSGHRFEDFDVRIFDKDDRECAPNEPGEIVLCPLRPGVMFDGYWQRPDATAEASRGGWFYTGDIGRIDAEGYLSFVDRKKDYMRRGGENVSSYELEMALRAHPEIEDLAAHSVPSGGAEDEIKITVVRVAGSHLTEEALCRWAVDQLPYFAVPRYIEFRSELPRNGVGRVLKYELRNEGLTAATWDRHATNIVVRPKRAPSVQRAQSPPEAEAGRA